ncbi:MAG: hypothetical protein GY778_17510 [bacterium]|nr:hypothetical protein [bacterium]
MAEAAITMSDRGADVEVYVRPTPVAKRPPGRKRGDARDAAALPGVWADIDIASPRTAKKYPPDEAAAHELLKSLPESTLINHTGGGFHTYWLFDEPWVFADDDEREQAKALVRRWQERVRESTEYAIDSTWDLARVLRVPGTFNCKDVKYGGKQRPVRQIAKGPTYGRAELERLAPAPETEAPSAPAPKAKTGGKGALIVKPNRRINKERLEPFLDNDTRIKATWDLDREDLPSASEYRYALIGFAVNAGWIDQDIADLLTTWAVDKDQDVEKVVRLGEKEIAKIRASGLDLCLADEKWKRWAIDKVRKKLKRLNPTENIRLHEYGSGPDTTYELVDDHLTVKLGSIETTGRWERIQWRFLGQTHINLSGGSDDDDEDTGKLTGKSWKGVITLLIDERLIIKHGADDTEERRTRELLDEYTGEAEFKNVNTEDPAERRQAIQVYTVLMGTVDRRHQKPFFDQAGRMYVHLPSFRFWVMRRGGELVTEKGLADRLRKAGFEKDRFYATGSPFHNEDVAEELGWQEDQYPTRSWRWISKPSFREGLV